MPHNCLQPWHSIHLATVFDHLQATPNGLTTSDAQRRFQQAGANCLPRQTPPSSWQILLRQFRSPLIYILGLAAAVSTAIGDIKDAGFIIGVLGINAAIGGYQEWRAEQSSHALQQLSFPEALQPLADRIQARDIVVFSGALDINKLNPVDHKSFQGQVLSSGKG